MKYSSLVLTVLQLFLILLMMGGLFTSSANAQTYEVINLGTLNYTFTVSGINDLGNVVGTADTDSGTHAFLWQNGTMTDLRTLGGVRSEALGINNSNQVVGSASPLVGSQHAFLWQNGTMTDLGTLGGSSSRAYDINNSGQVVGEASSSGGDYLAFVWQNGTMTDLGTLGGEESIAKGINDSGHVVGSSDLSAGGSHAFLWKNGAMTDLGTLGGYRSHALGINNSGQVVGDTQSSGGFTHAILWQNSTMTDLGTLGGISSRATGINNSGQVVGSSSSPVSSQHAFLWQNGTMTDLNSLIDSTSGWILETANGINSQGQIVGSGTHNGQPRAFLLRPKVATVTVTRPLAGERWIAGERDTIRWTEGAGAPLLRIEFTDDDGANYYFVEDSVRADSLHFFWSVPNALSTKCRLRLIDMQNDAVLAISGQFKVKGIQLTRYDAQGQYEAFDQQVHGWPFGNAMVNKWPVSWWGQFNYQQGVDPYTNKPYPPEEPFLSALPGDFPDWPLFVSVFGVDQCYWNNSGVLQYKATALWKWGNMKKQWGGSCSGFALSALLAFDDKVSFINSFPEVGAFDNLFTRPIKDSTRNVINRLWIYWFGASHQQYVSGNSTKTPTQTLRDIRDMLLDEHRDDRYLYIANNGPGGGAHAINAYKVKPFSFGLWFISVYDNSYFSDVGAEIVIDTSANGGDGTWFYALWPGWGGAKGIYLMDPVSTYLAPPILPKASYSHGQLAPASLLDANVVDVYNTQSADILIKNPAGKRIGYQDSLVIDELDNGVPNIPATASLYPPIGYYLPVDDYDVGMTNFGDSVSHFSFSRDSILYTFGRFDALVNQTDLLRLQNGFSLSSHDSEDKLVNLETIIVGDTIERAFDVLQMRFQQDDSIHLKDIDRKDLKLENIGSAKTYDLRIVHSSPQSERKFLHGQITFTANSSHSIMTENDSLATIKILIDNGNDGTIDDTLTLSNEVTGVDDRGSLLKPSEYSLAQNYPNPFNPLTVIRYSLPVQSHVALKVYNVLGQVVAVLVDGMQEAGYKSAEWNAGTLPSGVYVYRLSAGSYTEVKKMVLLR